MTRIALIALGILLALGLIVSVLPVSSKAALGDVRLEGVDLELYPASDPDAKWSFAASSVVYNPDTRESQVALEGTGKRILKGATDLELKAADVVIDGNDNLRMQSARIYIPDGCYLLNLRSQNGQPVVIDQQSGFRSPYVDLDSENLSFVGTEFTSSFDMKNTSGLIEAKAAERALKTCAKIRGAF